MSHSEWELFEIAEDIEPGDCVTVEDGDGGINKCIYVKASGKFVFLRDVSTKETKKFSAESLEEIEGDGYITGKYNG